MSSPSELNGDTNGHLENGHAEPKKSPPRSKRTPLPVKSDSETDDDIHVKSEGKNILKLEF